MKKCVLYCFFIIFFLSISILDTIAIQPKYATPSHPNLTKISINHFSSTDGDIALISDSNINRMEDGAKDEDSDPPLYPRAWNHYYDFFHRDNNGGGFRYEFDSAKQWAYDNVTQSKEIYGGVYTWETAIQNYKSGNISEAYFCLGHILHLIQDMTIPSHTRNDAHLRGSENNYGDWYEEYEDWVHGWIDNNIGSISDNMLFGTGILELNSLDEYFDLLSNYTQRHFYSGYGIKGTVFSTSFSESNTKESIFPAVTSKREEDYDGKKFYFAFGMDPEGSGEIHLAYRVKISKDWETWSAEHPAVYHDTWKRAGKLAMRATAGVVKLFLKNVSASPIVQTNLATAVSEKSAALNGSVNPNGLVTNYWFEYGTSSTLATYSSTQTKSAGTGTISQSFSEPISGLQVGTTYYFRVVATNSNGTTRGMINSFTTTPGTPSKWIKTYGGSFWETANAIQQTLDGGYIIAGYTTTFGAGGQDIYLIKTDSSGNMFWSKTFGGLNDEIAYAVLQTTDGGYIIGGKTSSFGAGGYEAYLIKTDSNGNMLWSKTYGEGDESSANALQQTQDGGFIIAGYTSSFGIDGSNTDVYLVKTDSNGNILWSKTHGGSLSYDFAYAVQQTTDGGFIVAGNTDPYPFINTDVYLIKTDSSGNLLWSKTYGYSEFDSASSVKQTSDGGYIVAGHASSFGYLIKTDSSGSILWYQTIGGADISSIGIASVLQTSGGYIIVGTAHPYGSYSNAYISKTDSNGNIVWWNWYVDTLGDDSASAVQQTMDGGFVVAGNSINAGNNSYADVLVIKTDSNGITQ